MRWPSTSLSQFGEPAVASGAVAEADLPEGGLTGPRWPGDPAWAAQLAVAAAGTQRLSGDPSRITESQAIWVAQSANDPAERRRALLWLGTHAPATAFVAVAQIANHERDPDLRREAHAAIAAFKNRFHPDALAQSAVYPDDVLGAMTVAPAAKLP